MRPRHHSRHVGWGEGAVGVEEAHDLAAGRDGAGEARRAEAAPRLDDHARARGGRERARGIGRAVVDDDDLVGAPEQVADDAADASASLSAGSTIVTDSVIVSRRPAWRPRRARPRCL